MSLLCALLGHNGETYTYDDFPVQREYVECTRCGKRKVLNGTGWTDE